MRYSVDCKLSMFSRFSDSFVIIPNAKIVPEYAVGDTVEFVCGDTHVLLTAVHRDTSSPSCESCWVYHHVSSTWPCYKWCTKSRVSLVRPSDMMEEL
jgi:hypothetical protein